ncbi:MAG TPA: hypothetical protein VGK33_04355, partial [Chloroflexota bacterium]
MPLEAGSSHDAISVARLMRPVRRAAASFGTLTQLGGGCSEIHQNRPWRPASGPRTKRVKGLSMVMTREASEPRWPAGLALIGLIAALALLPGRLKLMPEWFVYALGFVVIAPMAAVGLTRTNVRWLRIERAILLGFFGVVTLLTFAGLTELIHTMIRRSSSLSGLTLLSSSIALWIANITNYSLLYWQLDRGGPEAR